jgi:hypothetical protein
MQKGIRRVITGDENIPVRDHARKQVQKTSVVVKKQVRKVVTGSSDRRLRDWIKDTKVVKTVDKFSFVLGVFVLCMTEFVVLEYPQHYGQYYVILVTYLMALRLYMYARNRWLYFLIDFCYFVNATCFISVLYLPDNASLWRLNYAVSNGTLLGALLAWRNSLVFHSLDKVTSIAIHLLPALLTYLERWSGPSAMCPQETETCSIGFAGAFVEPLLFYAFWQILYIVKTEIVDRERMIADPNIQTSLRWLTRDSKNVLHKIAKAVCRTLGVLQPDQEFDPEALKTKIVFWIGQLCFTVVTLLPTPFLFGNHAANTGYIIFVLSAAVYNGSNYYFEVFAARYLQKLEENAAARVEAQKNEQQDAQETTLEKASSSQGNGIKQE